MPLNQFSPHQGKLDEEKEGKMAQAAQRKERRRETSKRDREKNKIEASNFCSYMYLEKGAHSFSENCQ